LFDVGLNGTSLTIVSGDLSAWYIEASKDFISFTSLEVIVSEDAGVLDVEDSFDFFADELLDEEDDSFKVAVA